MARLLLLLVLLLLLFQPLLLVGGRWHLPFECCSVALLRYIKEANVNGIDDNTWAPLRTEALSL